MSKKSMKEHFKERFGGSVSTFSLDPPMPTSLNIELNNTCNQKCFFCPYHGEFAKHKVAPAVIDKESVYGILDQAKQLGIGSKELGFYLAGEPLLYRDLQEVISYARGQGFPYIFLTSNGVLASLERMKRLIHAGLDSIRFSVNASDASTYKRYHGTDSYDIVKSNISSLSKYIKANHLNIITSISCVITKETKGIQNTIREQFGDYVDEIIFIPLSLSRSIENKEIWDKYSLTNEGIPIDTNFICPILFNTMYINAKKEVVPCCEAYDTEFRFAKLEDNYKLDEIWNNEWFRKYRSIFVEGCSDKGTICHSCVLRRGGLDRMIMEEEQG